MHGKPPDQTGSIGLTSSAHGVSSRSASAGQSVIGAPCGSLVPLGVAEGHQNGQATSRGLMECVWRRETARVHAHVLRASQRARKTCVSRRARINLAPPPHSTLATIIAQRGPRPSTFPSSNPNTRKPSFEAHLSPARAFSMRAAHLTHSAKFAGATAQAARGHLCKVSHCTHCRPALS
jgi:hypothetical protein